MLWGKSTRVPWETVAEWGVANTGRTVMRDFAENLSFASRPKMMKRQQIEEHFPIKTAW